MLNVAKDLIWCVFLLGLVLLLAAYIAAPANGQQPQPQSCHGSQGYARATLRGPFGLLPRATYVGPADQMPTEMRRGPLRSWMRFGQPR